MIVDDFRLFLDRSDLPTKDQIIVDGRLHRFHVIGDAKGSKNGWYVLFGDGVPVGSFGSWKTGFCGSWCAQSDGELTPSQRKEYRELLVKASAAREAEEQIRRREARDKASLIWRQGTPAFDNHPYLLSKGVGNYGLRMHKASLVIPLRDSSGHLHSLQFIDTEGNKRFLSGGRKKGCYFSIGAPASSLCIAEGYATAASIYESTGLPVAVAFDAGNLEPVALELRAKFPQTEIILCADNDLSTSGNVGLSRAREAAAAVGALLSVAGGSV